MDQAEEKIRFGRAPKGIINREGGRNKQEVPHLRPPSRFYRCVVAQLSPRAPLSLLFLLRVFSLGQDERVNTSLTPQMCLLNFIIYPFPVVLLQLT